jgi:hypothetical protein
MTLRFRGFIRGLLNLLMVVVIHAAVGELLSREDFADSLPLILTLKIVDLIDEIFQEIVRITIFV